MRPYFDDGKGRVIYCGDARDVARHIYANVLLTDPPWGLDGGRGGDARTFRKADYGATLWRDDLEYIRDVVVPVIEQTLVTMRRGAVTPGVRSMRLYPPSADVGCFWHPAGLTHGPWGFATFSPILYYGKDHRAGNGALPSGRAVVEPAVKVGHPCPKPIEAWRWLCDKVSAEMDTIIDPFMGSGTTLVAAKELGRKAIGIEIEERYCEIAARRLEQEVFAFESPTPTPGQP